MGEDYVIKLGDNSAPYSLYVPRNVAIPLHPKVKLELERIESMGVISKVEHPTDWCVGMVVVPKPLNNIVSREPHPIPTCS